MIKSVFISGANGGIGSALCRKYTAEGYFVIATDVHEQPAHDACNEYYAIALDRYASDEAYRTKIEEQMKHLAPEVVINNAAIQLIGPFEKFELDQWNASMDVNLTSAFLLIKNFYVALKEHKGQVINIASIHSRLTKPGFFAYATSKAALVGLTNALAVEFKGDITVNAVSPAAIATDMLKAGFDNDEGKVAELAQLHPSQELGNPDDLASFIFGITAANNRFVNGANFEVDGGISGALLDLEH